MTNQEAIRILDEQRNKFMDERIDFGGVNEAYNIAIQAIKEKSEEQKTSGEWKFVCHNPSYSPLDNSPYALYRCTNCRYTTGSTTNYCPICGSKNQP